MVPVGDESEVKAAKALSLPTRSAILAHLLRSGSRTAREVADEFRLHPNVARAHLDLLVEAGFLATGVRRQGKGRPAKVYFTWEGEMAVLEDWEVSPPQPLPTPEILEETVPSIAEAVSPFRLISAILIRITEQFDSKKVYPIAEKIAREEGRKLMLDYRGGGLDFAAAVKAMVEELRRYAPRSRVARLDHDYAEIETRDCPFRDIALEHSDLVLILDPALHEGAMEGLGHPSEVELETSVARGDNACRLVIRKKEEGKRPTRKEGV